MIIFLGGIMLRQRSIVFYSGLIALCLCFSGNVISCSDGQRSDAQGYVKFGLPVNGSLTENLSKKTDRTPYAVMLTVKGEGGDIIFDSKIISLLAFGNGYITGSISLPVGSYLITQFVILNDSSQVIYATPKDSSVFASYVSDPLPIYFAINESEVTTVSPEVLPVWPNSDPSDFGYIKFAFSVVEYFVSQTVLHGDANDSVIVEIKRPIFIRCGRSFAIRASKKINITDGFIDFAVWKGNNPIVSMEYIQFPSELDTTWAAFDFPISKIDSVLQSDDWDLADSWVYAHPVGYDLLSDLWGWSNVTDWTAVSPFNPNGKQRMETR